MLTLYKGFKYDNRYDYIKTFKTKAEQDNYFNSLEKIYCDDYDYIREYEPFRVELSHAYLTTNGVNYLKFNNGYKDMYAFITAKNYINDDVTELLIEIDVIQTFMFDIDIKNSFIERKVCTIDEISDFDEGLYIGEHEVVENNLVFNKDSVYFAMFNGFKDQQLIFDDNNVLKSVVDLPYSTSKPLTIIDGIQYPLYFMPLQENYRQATYEKINLPSAGETVGGTISAKFLRFIKGFEGFTPTAYYHNGESARTGGYGIREDYQKKYFDLLGAFPCTEQKASEVLAQLLNNEFASALYYQMLRDGLTGDKIKQKHFDAFLSLSMNGGLGAVTTSPMYAKYLINQNDANIYDDWLNWYVYGENPADGVLPGLVARRKEEATIFRDGIYNYRVINIWSDGSNVGIVTDNNGHGYIPNTVIGGV